MNDDNESKKKIEDVLERLGKSKFRTSFNLKEKDKEYVTTKGSEMLRSHTNDFINRRLAPKDVKNDGNQTPTHGHPVFVAQHATATCCRGCLSKWHNIDKGKDMTDDEKGYVADLIMTWIDRQMND